MKTEAIRLCIQTQYGTEDYAEARKELNALLAENAAQRAENLKLLQMVIDRNIELGYYTEHLIEQRDEMQTRAARVSLTAAPPGEATG